MVENFNFQKKTEGHLPQTSLEQPEFSEIKRTEWMIALKELYSSVVHLLKKSQIEIVDSSFRLKTVDSMGEKISREAGGMNMNPLLDIYGIRIILKDSEQIKVAIDTIKKAYPTPSEFPWGVPSVRSGGNSASHQEYFSTRMNIVFFVSGKTDAKIAEIQLMTPQQYEVSKQHREFYEAGRGKRKMATEITPIPNIKKPNLKEDSPRLEARRYFGGFLVDKRRVANKSISSIAREIGEQISYVESIEKGDILPSKDKLARIAKAYGCDLRKLTVAFEVSQK